jgi:hypothetical protein
MQFNLSEGKKITRIRRDTFFFDLGTVTNLKQIKRRKKKVKHIFGPTQGGRQKNHYGLYVFFIFQKIYLCQLLVDFLFCFHKFVFQVLKTKSALLTFLIFFFFERQPHKKDEFLSL